jgi:hypothetical protein
MTPKNFPIVYELLVLFMNNNKQPHKSNDIPAKLLGAFYNLISSCPLFFINQDFGISEAEGVIYIHDKYHRQHRIFLYLLKF